MLTLAWMVLDMSTGEQQDHLGGEERDGKRASLLTEQVSQQNHSTAGRVSEHIEPCAAGCLLQKLMCVHDEQNNLA